jgi:hypothetical protein
MEIIKKLDFLVRDLMILLLSFQIMILGASINPVSKTINEVVIGIWGILFVFDLFIKKEEAISED